MIVKNERINTIVCDNRILAEWIVQEVGRAFSKTETENIGKFFFRSKA
jgi:hypothetical protein